MRCIDRTVGMDMSGSYNVCVCVLVFVTVAGLMFFFAGVKSLDSLPPSCVEQTKRRKKL